MANKIQKQLKRKMKKTQKRKNRQEKIQKQAPPKTATIRSDIEARVDDAMILADAMKFEQAAVILDKLKKKHGNHPHVNYGLGVLAAFGCKYDEAVHFFNKTVQISPYFIEAYFNLGLAYRKQLKIPEMVTSFRKVVEIGEPGSDLVKNAKNDLIDLEKTSQKFNGISLDSYLEGYRIFEQGLDHMESENWEEAIAAFNDAIKINPDNVQSYGNLGISYASIGKKQDALTAFDKSIALDPDYEPALMNRKIVESLKEGERLNEDFKMIQYYRDYTLKNKSYRDELIESQ